MSPRSLTAPSRKAIDHYYQELAAYGSHNVTHETATRSAFQKLLENFAQSVNWLLIGSVSFAKGWEKRGREGEKRKLKSSEVVEELISITSLTRRLQHDE